MSEKGIISKTGRSGRGGFRGGRERFRRSTDSQLIFVDGIAFGDAARIFFVPAGYSSRALDFDPTTFYFALTF